MALKRTSSTVSIGFSITESAPNTFTEIQVDLNLSPLDNEVFVVQSINLDPFFPDALAATNTSVNCALTATSQSAAGTVGVLADANTLSRATTFIAAAGFVDGGVGFQQQAIETPPANLDYIGIIATSDFFVQVEGIGNTLAKGAAGKLYGYRAKADAATYAALVQSEVLSA